MAPWARASELHRLLACPAAGHLDKLVTISERRDDAAAWGTAMHLWAATGEFPGGLAPRRLKALQDRLTVLEEHDLTRERLWPPGGEHEVAVAVNVADPGYPREQYTGPLEEADAWKMAHDDRFVVGTVDYVGTVMSEEFEPVLWVDDLKTGAWDIDPPLDRPQLLFYASAMQLLRGGDAYVSLTHWPRSPAGEPPYRRWGDRLWTWIDQMAFMLSVTKAREASLRSGRRYNDLLEPDARPGPQCGFCPSNHICPEGIA